MNKTISEIFDEFEKAPTRADKIHTLRANYCFALKYILTGSFHPDIQFVFDKIPEYRKSNIPAGLGYTSIHQELGRAYLFEKNNTKVNPNLTLKRKEQLLIQILEALEDRESSIFSAMLMKKQVAIGLTYDLVSEAFPGMLPFRQETDDPIKTEQKIEIGTPTREPTKNFIEILKSKYTTTSRD